MYLLLLIFLTYVGASFGCMCSGDEKGIVCSGEQNVSPSQMSRVCPDTNKVESIALGYSVYCYNDVLSMFPRLSVFYVAGEKGSSCDCYSNMLCLIKISGCECLDASATYTQVSPYSSTTFQTNFISSTVDTNSSGETTHETIRNAASQGDIILIVVLIIALVMSCIIIFILYQFCFKALRRRLIEQRRQLAISNAALARNLTRSGRSMGSSQDPPEPTENTGHSRGNGLDDVELGDSDSCEVNVHFNNDLVGVGCSTSVGIDRLAASESKEKLRTPDCRGTQNPTYETPDSEQKLQGPITRSRRKLRY